MKCPSDSTPMSGGAQGRMRYEACPHCRGLWVNAETLAAPNPPVFVLFKNLPGIEPVVEPPSGQAICHACGLALVGRSVGETSVGICPKCANIWLAAGTFDRVAAFYRSRPRNDWPHVSQLEGPPTLPGAARGVSGLPRGVRAVVGRPSEDPEARTQRMREGIDLIQELVDRGLAEKD